MKKVKNKDEEMAARDEVDDKKRKKIEDEYEKLLGKCSKAIDMASTEFWLEGFRERGRERDNAFKQLVDFLVIKPYELQLKTQLSEFNSAFTKLKKAIDAVDEYTRDVKGAVENLQSYITDYPKLPLFESGIAKTADFNFKTGVCRIVKMKKTI